MHRGYGNSAASDFAHGNPDPNSPLSQSMNTTIVHRGTNFHEDFDASRPNSSVLGGGGDGGHAGMDRSTSLATTAVPAQAPARSNTLKKKSSMKRVNSLKRSSSKRSMKAGSISGYGGGEQDQKYNSYSSTPIPTQGAPTEVLANRFQAWRQLLKSLIAYFREIQTSYEMRAKAVHKVQGTISNITHPTIFMSENGLSDATRILDEFHKRSLSEAHKSRDIENDVIGALTGLRSDLGQKIKEIKSLSGDFKNSVDKEKEATRREVEKLQEVLQHADHEDGSATGKNDPFVVKLGVDRTIERQIDEENYLHRVCCVSTRSEDRILNAARLISIWKAQDANSSRLSLARSRKRTTHWPAFSSVKAMMRTTQSSFFVRVRLRCPRKPSGLNLCSMIRTSSTPTYHYAVLKISTSRASTTWLHKKYEPACLSARASTSSLIRLDGTSSRQRICTSSSQQTKSIASRRLCRCTLATRSLDLTLRQARRATSSCSRESRVAAYTKATTGSSALRPTTR